MPENITAACRVAFSVPAAHLPGKHCSRYLNRQTHVAAKLSLHRETERNVKEIQRSCNNHENLAQHEQPLVDDKNVCVQRLPHEYGRATACNRDRMCVLSS